MTVGDLLEYLSFQLSKNHVGVDDTVYAASEGAWGRDFYAVTAQMGKTGVVIRLDELPHQG